MLDDADAMKILDRIVLRSGRAGLAMAACLVVMLAMLVSCRGAGTSAPQVTVHAAKGASRPLEGVALVERLSLMTRGRRLDSAEAAQVAKRLRNEALAAVYRSFLDAWLSDDFYASLARDLMPGEPAIRSLFVGELERTRMPDGQWLYALPPSGAATTSPGAPCPPSEIEEVWAWWAHRRVRVCKTSYMPRVVFDEVGYCGGQTEPTVPAPRRPGCGCGPLLLGCMPPREEDPTLESRLERGVVAEVERTGARVLREGSFDGLLTTSTTWQTGLVEFFYLRRGILSELRARPFTPEREPELIKRVVAVDLTSPGRWADRTGPYEGSGLFISTLMMNLIDSTYRDMAHRMLNDFLCMSFKGIGVDADSILAAVGEAHGNLRQLGVYESPMRSQKGCQGCHNPMDGAVGFLLELGTPMHGSAPTGVKGRGELFIGGTSDLRGTGKTFRDFNSLIVAQPEFPACIVKRMANHFTGSLPTAVRERELVALFESSGRRLDRLLRALLTSEEFASPSSASLAD